MYRLVLFRHGEAFSDSSDGKDHSRQLTENGKQVVKSQAKKLLEQGILPDLILSSDAARTIETSQIIKETFPESPFKASPSLYLSGIDSLTAELAEISSKEGTFVLVGHNPGWSNIATQLTGTPIGLGPGDYCVCSMETEEDLCNAICHFGSWQRQNP